MDECKSGLVSFLLGRDPIGDNGVRAQESRAAVQPRFDLAIISAATNLLYNVGKSPADGGNMMVAFEINFALWGMIVCATIEVAQVFQVLP